MICLDIISNESVIRFVAKVHAYDFLLEICFQLNSHYKYEFFQNIESVIWNVCHRQKGIPKNYYYVSQKIDRKRYSKRTFHFKIIFLSLLFSTFHGNRYLILILTNIQVVWALNIFILKRRKSSHLLMFVFQLFSNQMLAWKFEFTKSWQQRKYIVSNILRRSYKII